jgi:hypothetical protein
MYRVVPHKFTLAQGGDETVKYSKTDAEKNTKKPQEYTDEDILNMSEQELLAYLASDSEESEGQGEEENPNLKETQAKGEVKEGKLNTDVPTGVLLCSIGTTGIAQIVSE